MRPSSHWRKQNDDSVDIFGNRKRGGGGDPVRNKGSSSSDTSSMSMIEKYKLLQQKLSNPGPTKITSIPSQSSSDARKSENELFRQQLDAQIAEQKHLKLLQKMKDIEQEKLAQYKLEKELKELQSKHRNAVNNEQNLNAGFLRYRNSHSHIPPKQPQPAQSMQTKLNDPPKQAQLQYQEVYEENKEREQSNHDNIES